MENLIKRSTWNNLKVLPKIKPWFSGSIELFIALSRLGWHGSDNWMPP